MLLSHAAGINLRVCLRLLLHVSHVHAVYGNSPPPTRRFSRAFTRVTVLFFHRTSKGNPPELNAKFAGELSYHVPCVDG